MYIHTIKDVEGDWIHGDEAIGEYACNYFEDLFTETSDVIGQDLLSHSPSMIFFEDNTNLKTNLTMIEPK